MQRHEQTKTAWLKRERAAAAQKQAEEETTHPFRPQLSPPPASLKWQLPLHLREHAKPRNLSADFLYNFTPTISEASKQITRTKPVDALLYQDALRRHSDRAQVQSRVESPALPVSPGSDKTLRRLFCEEFSKACQDEGIPQTLAFPDLQRLLVRLRFTLSSDEQLAKDLWTWLSHDHLPLPICQQALAAVLGIAKASVHAGVPLSHGTLEGDRLHFTKQEVVEVHKLYEAACKLRYVLRRQKREKHTPEPVLKRSHSVDACTRLAGEGEKKRAKLEALKKEKEQRELGQCSFRPHVLSPAKISPAKFSPECTERLYAEGKKRAERQQQRREEKENKTERFSFKPSLSPRVAANTPSPKGAAAAVERLRKGTDQRVLTDRLQQQGFPFSPSRALATIRVNIRPGESGFMEVFPHSDLPRVVRDFAAAHSTFHTEIPAPEENRLLHMVRKQLSKL